MSDVIERVWTDWKTIRKLGEGSFGKVYEVRREQFGIVEHSAVKVISIPSSESEMQSLRNEGMSQNDVTHYYRGIVEDFVQEIALLSKLKGHMNIVSYEDFTVVERHESFGWDILIRMELLTSLPNYLRAKTDDGDATIGVTSMTPTATATGFDERELVKMAIDICRALEICHARHIVHRDIKPDNIFVSEDGDFKLGDFGVARTVEKTISGLSKKGTYTFMAPEIYKSEPCGLNVDLYSLGILMYRLLNNNRDPFMPPAPQPINYTDKNDALVRRMNGEAIPAPVSGSKALWSIVQKACAYHAADRYQSAKDMREALEHVFDPPRVVAAKPVAEQEVVTTPTVSKKALLEQGMLALEKGEWGQADELFEQVLNLDAKCAMAYFGKMMAQSWVHSVEELGDLEADFSTHPLYKKAYQFADDNARKAFDSYVEKRQQTYARTHKEEIYSRAKEYMSRKSERGYREAITLLEQIRWYRDADDLLQGCRQSLKVLAVKEVPKASEEHKDEEDVSPVIAKWMFVAIVIPLFLALSLVLWQAR